MDIWHIENVDVFGGYGVRGVGRSEQEARDAFWACYQETSKTWNAGISKAGCGQPSLEAFEEYWGLKVSRYKLGKGYFGDEDEWNPDMRDGKDVRKEVSSSA